MNKYKIMEWLLAVMSVIAAFAFEGMLVWATFFIGSLLYGIAFWVTRDLK